MRALRDKYRDVYQRQTVQTQKGAPQARQPLGGENTRTQTKSEIMDEVLKRFEAQHAKLERKADAATASAAKRAAARPTSKAPAKAPSKASAKTATKSTTKTPVKTVAKASTKASATTKVIAKKPARKRAAPKSAVPTLEKLVKDVRKAVAKKHEADAATAHQTELPHATPPSEKLASAPTDITPVTKRLNPLKADPLHRIIQASARSQTRSAQAKRDAR